MIINDALNFELDCDIEYEIESPHFWIGICLMIFQVYDVTPFLDDHPGGDEVLESSTGKQFLQVSISYLLMMIMLIYTNFLATQKKKKKNLKVYIKFCREGCHRWVWICGPQWFCKGDDEKILYWWFWQTGCSGEK